MLPLVGNNLKFVVGSDTVLVSMLAGVNCASLRQRLSNASPIVRILPNLPVAQVQGVVPLYSEDVDSEVTSFTVAAVVPARLTFVTAFHPLRP